MKQDLIEDAVNAYYHQALKELERDDLGDIERKNWEHIKKECRSFFNPIIGFAATPSTLPETVQGLEIDEMERAIRNDNVPEQPYYKGRGEHSVSQLEAICKQYKEYVHFLNSRPNSTPSANELESSEMERAIGDKTGGNEREMFTVLSQYELYIEYCDKCIEAEIIPCHFVQWREKNNLPQL